MSVRDGFSKGPSDVVCRYKTSSIVEAFGVAKTKEGDHRFESNEPDLSLLDRCKVMNNSKDAFQQTDETWLFVLGF